MKKTCAFALALAIISLPFPAKAEHGSVLSLGLGAYDIFGDDDNSADLRLEYRPGIPLLTDNLSPWVGGELTTHAALWVGGGLLYEYELSPNVDLIPSFGVGYYSGGNSDLEIKDGVQFRPQLELSYQFESGHALSAFVSHASDFGLKDEDNGVNDDSNDDAETLGVYWHVPFNKVFQTE